jgi:hypothetical protein
MKPLFALILLVAVASAAEGQDYTTGLVNWWTFDANGADSHGSDTLSGTGTPTHTTGKIGNCAVFNGSSQSYSAADNASLSVTGTYSMCGWFYINNFTATHVYCGKYLTGTNQREYEFLYVTGTNRIQTSASSNGQSGTAVSRAWSNVLSINTWYFIAWGVNVDSDEIWISVDGATPLTSSYTGAVYDGSSAFVVGNRDGATLWSAMRCDELARYEGRDIRSILSDLYNAGDGRSYADISSAPASVVPALMNYYRANQ